MLPSSPGPAFVWLADLYEGPEFKESPAMITVNPMNIQR
jgi:hypothetical protein